MPPEPFLMFRDAEINKINSNDPLNPNTTSTAGFMVQEMSQTHRRHIEKKSRAKRSGAGKSLLLFLKTMLSPADAARMRGSGDAANEAIKLLQEEMTEIKQTLAQLEKENGVLRSKLVIASTNPSREHMCDTTLVSSVWGFEDLSQTHTLWTEDAWRTIATTSTMC
ncbi:hypothetical protein SISNIDRAFT_464552 [Sistotremastrum niveocremeum HHB9708]|uniref:Uncharacterized protein n=1 Tax=Sistotremastrum niveocremeum HHB9708 TaxID=1314777 RepID=A0A164X119_9AGAM|nr:hypothetical protein SISNIDRAFT_464552 [Sistotremastrum niveocremeum HHB9708]